MKNILSIDLESWVHLYKDILEVEAEDASLKRKKLDDGYVVGATDSVLRLLDAYSQKATFFVVAEIYDWYPEVIKKIKGSGHEIGYHTHSHTIVKNGLMLKRELELSENFITVFKPLGFRAPQIYITEESFSVLKQWGFQYSSSTYDDYCISDISGIQEIPVSALSLIKAGRSKTVLPKAVRLHSMFSKIYFGSGLYLSFFGSKISYFIKHVNKKGVPAVVFIHPWQLYPPKEKMRWGRRIKILLRHPLYLFYTRNMLSSFEQILKNNRFTSFEGYFDTKSRTSRP
jgi:peptidoglycan/xylan/chitin deacetylase (PgdA/CDA1 family)